MVKQNMTCEDTMMQQWMFKEGMYVYIMSLTWQFVRMIDRIGNHVIRRMRSFAHLDGLTVMAKVE